MVSHFFADPRTWLVSTYFWWSIQLFSTQNFAEMTRKKLRVGARPTRRDRDRKDRDVLRKAHQRAAKAAALREEVGDIQEDVIPYELKGGDVGETIRLQRVNPSSVSGDAAQSAPQMPLPVASPPPQPSAPPPEPLSHIAAIHASLDCLPPHERQKLLADRTQRELKKGQLCISTGGCAKQALVHVQGNTELIGTFSSL